ncbi:hypothetical protein [Streptomyces sp. NRRL B-1347]|uniref:hypothetical protein n=1 Tax=Streptomyces sp. NRRL B-1347 TaxID=1476877 RepID=UPI0004C99F30|nr:hypothetical protein [Streptomyces sp. NRRL B-1347]
MTAYPAPHGPHGALMAADRTRPHTEPAEPAGREATRRGIALVRAYARGDSATVAAALATTDPAVRAQLPSVTGDVLRLVVGALLAGPHTLTPADVVRTADRIAAAGPPHQVPAATRAVRAWASRDDAELRTSWQDGTAGAHGTAVLAAALAVAAWGEAPFLHLLAAFDELTAARG